MATGYNIVVSGGLLDGADIVRALEIKAESSGFDFEDFWQRFEIAAASGGTAATRDIQMDVLDNPRMIIIEGAEGITVTLGSTGTDEISCDPLFITTDETDGTGIDQITLCNHGSREQKVTVIAFSYKT